MTASPSLSIIVPAYNVAASIDKCIASICIQTRSDFEILLIDDGSEDATPDLGKLWSERDERIRFFLTPPQGCRSCSQFWIARSAC